MSAHCFERNHSALALVGLVVLFLASTGASAQTVTEYLVPTPPPLDLYSICLGPDGAVWFGEARTAKVGRIASDGTITEFSTDGNPTYQMVTGPDGNLWIASGGIGRLTPGGQFTDFPVPLVSPGVGGDVVDLTAGPDGAVWFADVDGNRIGRVSPAGDITLYPLPASARGPYAITLGPDGNLWYAAEDDDVIGRMTPAGIVTTFSFPGTEPFELTAGPDGNIWFSMRGSSNGVGRLSPSGELTTFGANQIFCYRLAPGPDGNLWCTDTTRVSRITPEGEITSFDFPGSVILDLVGGSDGGIWFPDNMNNRIERLEIPGFRQPVELVRDRGNPRSIPPRPPRAE